MNDIPTFMDFEASSLSFKSYPIEIAWNLSDTRIETHLISPAGVEEWTEWDAAAEKLHGISRKKLLDEGESPEIICRQLNEQLAGKHAYTDSPRFDGMWLGRLFSACDVEEPLFAIKHIDELLLGMLSPEDPGKRSSVLQLESLKMEARRQKPKQHRAQWDVEFLMELWRLALKETSK
jgi:hypothetical protein